MDETINYQNSKKSSIHILGGGFGQVKCSFNANWETTNSEFGAQLMFTNVVPKNGETYHQLSSNAKYDEAAVTFIFTRSKTDDFLFSPHEYEVQVDLYEYENNSGFFINQKLSGTIKGTGNYLDFSTKEEAVIPFEAKFQFAE